MLIALLVVLGVDLIVVGAFAALVITRRRWLKRQPGTFAGAVRVSKGDLDGFDTKWKRGSGRWVRGVFVWTKAPFLLWNVLTPIDSFAGERTPLDGEAKRLGDKPIIVQLAAGAATIEIAARTEQRDLATGPFATTTRAEPDAA